MDQRTRALIDDMRLLWHWLSTVRTNDPEMIEFLKREAPGGYFRADPEVFISAIDQLFADSVPLSNAAQTSLQRMRNHLDSLRGVILIESDVIRSAPDSMIAPFSGKYFDVSIELASLLNEMSGVADA